MAQDKLNSTSRDEKPRSGKSALTIAGIVLLVSGFIALQAFTANQSFAHFRQFVSGESERISEGLVHEAGWRGHKKGHGGKHMSWLANLTDEEIGDKVTRMIKHLAIEIEATPDQEQQIIDAVVPVVIKLKPYGETMGDTGDEMRELLTADTIDREAIEQLRAEKFADAETISRELTGVVAVVAEILTPEQRQMLSERFESRKGWRRGWGR